VPWYQQPVRPSLVSPGIGGLPLSQNIPLASCVLALGAAVEEATGAAALAVVLADATGGVADVPSVVLACPHAQTNEKVATTQRDADMGANILGRAGDVHANAR
jgi:hypothetical protein